MSANTLTRFNPPPADGLLANLARTDSHTVQFYEDDKTLLTSLCDSLATALRAGDAVVVIASSKHRRELEKGFKVLGIDLARARSTSRYMAFDAADSLSLFMFNRTPDARIFSDFARGVITRARAAATSPGQHVRLFGEMVALLCQEGNFEAALLLEQYWNDVAEQVPFHLHCAYPVACFASPDHLDTFKSICAVHTHTTPCESYTSLGNEDARSMAISVLQQKALALSAAVEQRDQMAAALASEVEDLQRLHEMVTRLSWHDLGQLMHEIIGAAASLQSAEMGMLSMLQPEQNELLLAGSVGFTKQFLQEVKRVPGGAGACGLCMAERKRVIVEDTETDPRFAPFREAARQAGFRALHSTPLVDRSGNLVGVLSVHFTKPYRPSPRETKLTDLYARMAANAIENAQLYHRSQEEFEKRKRAQEELLRTEKLAAAGRMAATLAHEINNPLESVANCLYIAKSETNIPNEVREVLDVTERELGRVSHLTKQTLGFYRDTSTPADVDLSQLVSDLLPLYNHRLVRRGITIECACEPAPLRGMTGELKQIISNLLANAIDAARTKVIVRTSVHSNQAVLEVEDDGPGVSEGLTEKIFEPFFTTKKDAGNGLGLWVTKNLVERHHGTIQVRNVTPGAVFAVELPIHEN